ncbi:hypothetical protein RN001_011696 [Aquatica leii]|uniref:Uncharacterized protein n=1 Tax=Aquatica leii TaxID=1421715 RepID=A0AAN7P1W9_9COLE|nr:hypothetical protein RN001_011696 [Aquatica leii]
MWRNDRRVLTQAELESKVEKIVNGKDSDVDQTSGSESEEDVVKWEDIDSEDQENISTDDKDDDNSSQSIAREDSKAESKQLEKETKTKYGNQCLKLEVKMEQTVKRLLKAMSFSLTHKRTRREGSQEDDIGKELGSPIRTAPLHSTEANCPSSSKTSRTLPVCKWGVTFKVDSSPNKLYKFLMRLEELLLAREVRKEDLFLSAVDLFTGPAIGWFRAKRKGLKNCYFVLDKSIMARKNLSEAELVAALEEILTEKDESPTDSMDSDEYSHHVPEASDIASDVSVEVLSEDADLSEDEDLSEGDQGKQKLFGKNSYEWSTQVPTKRGRPLARNYVFESRQVKGAGKNEKTYLEAWDKLYQQLFIILKLQTWNFLIIRLDLYCVFL